MQAPLVEVVKAGIEPMDVAPLAGEMFLDILLPLSYECVYISPF